MVAEDGEHGVGHGAGVGALGNTAPSRSVSSAKSPVDY